MPRSAIDPWTRAAARRLRSDETDFEVKLWWQLKEFRPHGAHFRRQAPIGRYIADFAWLSGRLIIELDGDQHSTHRLEHDANRDAWLASRGFEVLRIWNNELIDNLEGVMDTIFAKIVERGANPTPTAVPAVDPPRKGEGRRVRRASSQEVRSAEPAEAGTGEQGPLENNALPTPSSKPTSKRRLPRPIKIKTPMRIPPHVQL